MKKLIKVWIVVSVLFIGFYVVKLTEISKKVTFVFKNPSHQVLEKNEADIILTMKLFVNYFQSFV